MEQIRKNDFVWRFYGDGKWQVTYVSPKTQKTWTTQVLDKEYDFFHYAGRLSQVYLKRLRWMCKRGF